MMKRWNFWIATLFPLGCIPLIRGALATLLGGVIYFPFRNNPGMGVLLILFLGSLGVWISGREEKALGKKDSPEIVIDELTGFMVAIYGISWEWRVFWMGFIIYRLIDASKPFPLRRAEKWKGGWGIMMDDIMAGIYTNIILRLVVTFLLK